MDKVTTITFDCYGTLIDWSRGLLGSFQDILGDALIGREDELFDVYVQAEAEIEAQPFQSYRGVLAETVGIVARHFAVPVSSQRCHLLADQLPDWVPFADTNAALTRLQRKFKLGVLSNIDRDLFAGTARHFDVAFDFLVSAQDVQSYKPGHAHFTHLMDRYAAKEQVLHVAQSLYHDVAPCNELGIATVWINRYNESIGDRPRPMETYTDLAALAERLVKA